MRKSIIKNTPLIVRQFKSKNGRPTTRKTKMSEYCLITDTKKGTPEHPQTNLDRVENPDKEGNNRTDKEERHGK